MTHRPRPSMARAAARWSRPSARSFGLALAMLSGPSLSLAQDTTHAIDQGVRVGITYAPGVRPSIVVLPARGADSVRAIVSRDLDNSDRFEIITLPNEDSVAMRLPSAAWNGAVKPPPPNYALFRTLGADYGVELLPASGSVLVRLHDLVAGVLRQEHAFALPDPLAAGFRMGVHRLSDEIVRWATGTPGIAASQVLYVANKRVYRIDSDGSDAVPITGEAEEALSPTWSPDGTRIAYTQFSQGHGAIVVITLATGARAVVPSTASGLNITPAFSPDGRRLAFAHLDEDGADVFTADIVEMCCVQRLTVGRYADNLSPTYSPDGGRIAFVSTRAGLPQIYVMAADGTDQELLAPFDYGVTGSSNAPEWSPDGASVVFHRDVSRNLQLFVMSIASRRVRQLTSTGRSEDATWAPDGRHLAFVSDRSGHRQLWIIDTETGRIRQLTTSGAARLPSWSRRLAGSQASTHQ